MKRYLRMGVLSSALVVIGALCVSPMANAAPRPRTGGLSGVVYGAAGSAISGATVRAYALPGQQAGCTEIAQSVDPSLWRVAAATTTRADGSYTLPITTGYYRIAVTPTDVSRDSFGYWVDSTQPDGSNVTGYLGYADDMFVPTGGRSGFAVHLGQPATVSGSVTDPDTGAPLPGIQVRAVPETIAQLTPVYPSTSTDATGHYALGGLPRSAPDPMPWTPQNEAAMWGLVMVDPTAWHGIFIWWHSLIDETTANDIAAIDAGLGNAVRDVSFPSLALTGRVVGKVVNEKGRPVPNIQVSVWSAFPWPPVFTDSKGRFTVPGGAALRFFDPAGKYRDAFYPGVPSEGEATIFQVAPGEQVTVTMKMLGDAARISGSAWYSIGQPAAGFHVGYTSVRCDGSFDVGGLWPGATSLDFIASIPDGNPTQTVHATLAAGQNLRVGEVTLPTWIIDGEILDQNTGEPVSGAQVDLMGANTWDEPHSIRYWGDVGVTTARAITDESGNFRLWMPDEPLGWPYLVVRDTQDPARFASQIYNGWPVTGDPDAVAGDTVTDDDPWDNQGTFYQLFVAEAGLNVRVVDFASGEPQESHGVTLLQYTGSGWEPVRGTNTDEDGWAHFAVAAGTYRVQVNSPYGPMTEYYQDANDVTGATDVAVAGGEFTQVTVEFGPFGP